MQIRLNLILNTFTSNCESWNYEDERKCEHKNKQTVQRNKVIFFKHTCAEELKELSPPGSWDWLGADIILLWCNRERYSCTQTDAYITMKSSTNAVSRLRETTFQSLDWKTKIELVPPMKCLSPCDQSRLIQGKSINP